MNKSNNKSEKQMTHVYFVRHAEPRRDWEDDETRPLTGRGMRGVEEVTKFFKEIHLDALYSSNYKRAIQTVSGTAVSHNIEIKLDARLRERMSGKNGNVGPNHFELFEKRWQDRDWCEDGGETINQTQKRNIQALSELLKAEEGRTIVIGTHGTALSTILAYYDNTFVCKDFLRIIDWMPYIIRLDFEGTTYVGKEELFHIDIPFN